MKNMVVILGAGSSKDFGLPLANEIFSYAYKMAKEENRSGARKLAYAASEVNEAMHMIYPNLARSSKDYPSFEETLTLIWDPDSLATLDIVRWERARSARHIFDSFVNMLGFSFAIGADVITREITDYGRRIALYKWFIESLLKSSETATFISLNYDTILDDILLNLSNSQKIRGYNYGISMRHLRTYASVRRGDIHLLKPHGSLNLAVCYHCKNFFRFNGNIFMAEYYYKCPACKRVSIKPLIIPPMHKKRDFIRKNGHDFLEQGPGAFKIYRESIDMNIRNALNRADGIFVIGYSMPSYDFDFKNLLLLGLMDNKNRDRVPIRIVTKISDKAQEAELQNKYKSLAGPVKVDGKDGFLSYIDTFGTV